LTFFGLILLLFIYFLSLNKEVESRVLLTILLFQSIFGLLIEVCDSRETTSKVDLLNFLTFHLIFTFYSILTLNLGSKCNYLLGLINICIMNRTLGLIYVFFNLFNNLLRVFNSLVFKLETVDFSKLVCVMSISSNKFKPVSVILISTFLLFSSF